MAGGDEEVVADQATGATVADLDDVLTDRVRLEVLRRRRDARAPVGVAEVEIDGSARVDPRRTAQRPLVDRRLRVRLAPGDPFLHPHAAGPGLLPLP